MARRAFVCAGGRALGAVCLSATGCGGADAVSAASPSAGGRPGEPPGVTVTADAVVVSIAANPELRRAGGALVVPQAAVIVLHTAPERYRALSAVCTHAGCLVARVEGERLVCPCHGSRFDFAGRVVDGPAPEPLAELPARYDADRAAVVVTRRA